MGVSSTVRPVPTRGWAASAIPGRSLAPLPTISRRIVRGFDAASLRVTRCSCYSVFLASQVSRYTCSIRARQLCVEVRRRTLSDGQFCFALRLFRVAMSFSTVVWYDRWRCRSLQSCVATAGRCHPLQSYGATGGDVTLYIGMWRGAVLEALVLLADVCRSEAFTWDKHAPVARRGRAYHSVDNNPAPYLERWLYSWSFGTFTCSLSRYLS